MQGGGRERDQTHQGGGAERCRVENAARLGKLRKRKQERVSIGGGEEREDNYVQGECSLRVLLDLRAVVWMVGEWHAPRLQEAGRDFGPGAIERQPGEQSHVSV